LSLVAQLSGHQSCERLPVPPGVLPPDLGDAAAGALSQARRLDKPSKLDLLEPRYNGGSEGFRVSGRAPPKRDWR